MAVDRTKGIELNPDSNYNLIAVGRTDVEMISVEAVYGEKKQLLFKHHPFADKLPHRLNGEIMFRVNLTDSIHDWLDLPRDKRAKLFLDWDPGNVFLFINESKRKG